MDFNRSQFVKELKARKLTIAIVESVTCGMIANMLAGANGVSDVFRGSLVCYSPELKKELLGVPESLMRRYTCESAQVTERLAKNLSKRISADVYAAITGLASPGGSETAGKPVGTVFISVYYKNKLYRLRTVFRGTSLEIRKKAARELLAFLLQTVKENDGKTNT